MSAGGGTGSVKDRMALSTVEGAEGRDELVPGDRVVEYTGGSTGSSLAMAREIIDDIGPEIDAYVMAIIADSGLRYSNGDLYRWRFSAFRTGGRSIPTGRGRS